MISCTPPTIPTLGTASAGTGPVGSSDTAADAFAALFAAHPGPDAATPPTEPAAEEDVRTTLAAADQVLAGLHRFTSLRLVGHTGGPALLSQEASPATVPPTETPRPAADTDRPAVSGTPVPAPEATDVAPVELAVELTTELAADGPATEPTEQVERRPIAPQAAPPGPTGAGATEPGPALADGAAAADPVTLPAAGAVTDVRAAAVPQGPAPVGLASSGQDAASAGATEPAAAATVASSRPTPAPRPDPRPATGDGPAALGATVPADLAAGSSDRGPQVARNELSPAVQRVLDAVRDLEDAPPPRVVVIETGEVRLRLGLRDDGVVRVTVVGESSPESDALLSDLGRDLEGRGLAADVGDRSRERHHREPQPDAAPTPTATRPRPGPAAAGLRL